MSRPCDIGPCARPKMSACDIKSNGSKSYLLQKQASEEFRPQAMM